MKTLTLEQAKKVVSEMKALFPEKSVKEIAAYLEMELTYQNTKYLIDAGL